VVVQLPNVAELVEVVFALFRMGALPVFALLAHRRTELRHIAEQAGAVAAVAAVDISGFASAETLAQLPDLRLCVAFGPGEPPPGTVSIEQLRAAAGPSRPARQPPGWPGDWW
jgi:2,3-dihydroxybenzoate-AMP ligase